MSMGTWPLVDKAGVHRVAYQPTKLRKQGPGPPSKHILARYIGINRQTAVGPETSTHRCDDVMADLNLWTSTEGLCECTQTVSMSSPNAQIPWREKEGDVEQDSHIYVI